MVRAGDFDGDGMQDLMVLAQYSLGQYAGTLHYFRGNGDGTFASAWTRLTGNGPAGLALGDVTGDLRPDVLVTHRDEGTVMVGSNLLGGPVAVPITPRASSLVARVLPSPAFGPFGVELSGSPGAAVRIEVFTVDGRRVGPAGEARLGSDGRGRIAMSAGTRPGVYLVRAVQGEDVSVARAVVLP